MIAVQLPEHDDILRQFNSNNIEYFFEIHKKTLQKAQNFQYFLIIGMGATSTIARMLRGVTSSLSDFTDYFHIIDYLDEINLQNCLNKLELNATMVIIISASGNTVETNCLTGWLHDYYKSQGLQLSKQCMVWTQQQESQLVDIAKSHDLHIYYESSIECGRYGIFADHNLLLMCLMQVDHIDILNGMRHAMQHHSSFLFDSDKPIAVYAGYGSCFEPLLQWVCQIISESLGKEGAGITPMFSIAPQDHHTMMQLYLDGPADKSFTMLHIKSATPSLMDSLLETMFRQAVQALQSRQLPVRVQEIEQWNAWSLGYFIMLNTLEVLHFAKKRGISAWTQPAVQEMKQRVYTCAKVV